MSNLLFNTRDQQFVLFEQLGIERLFEFEAFKDFSKEDILMILNEAEKMAVNEIAPTLSAGDKEGCRFQDGKVFVPECYHSPWKKYREAGWICPSDPPEVGGQGIPASVAFPVFEMMGAANYAFYMYGNLTHGAAGLLEVFGTEEQKNKYMYKMFAGAWGGTMCLTEPGAGSDVGALKTSAKRLPDGKYLITGTKCFISSGDHNLTPNIVHPVLARIEGDPPGTKGISIFIVPKYRVNDDGSIGEFNDVVTGGIEHKMGIKGSATATLNFGENGCCIGELLGNEREGIKIMFLMMNEARLNVGMQGLEAASAAYEHAVSYARERIQSANVLAEKGSGPVSIINHPDIRRKLMWMKSHIEGIRALCYFAAYCMDNSKVAETPEAKERWDGYLNLLIPVVKAYSTDKGFLVCSMGMDIYGGYGFCSEYPMEQYVRDEKIACIYEGTNGIQCNDLVGRKLAQRNGRNVMNLFNDILNNISKVKILPGLGNVAEILEAAADACHDLTVFLTTECKDDPAVVYLNATAFMDVFGDVVIGHFLTDAAVIASEKLAGIYAATGADTREKQDALLVHDKEAAFYSGKIASARFFAANLLSTVKSRCEAVKLRDKTPIEVVEAAFAW
ncbi:MAG: acyl-CoA dehydrogenase [Syntrophales bacterium]|nr:acyl-CoA dehydrogenase [Syntrophales bacterium]